MISKMYSFIAATTDYMRFGLTKLIQSDTTREAYNDDKNY